MQRVIVDGYNLMHQMPGLTRHMDRDLEHARDRLITLLADYSATKRVKVTVVFDGRGGQATADRPVVGGVEVIYSRSPQDADQRIKAMIARERSPKSCTVVTSDNSILIHVRDFGAKTVSSATFARSLSGSGQATSAGGQPLSDKPEMKPGDVAEWEEYLKSKGVDTSKGWF